MSVIQQTIQADLNLQEKHNSPKGPPVFGNPQRQPGKFLTAVILFGMYASFGMSWMAVIPLFGEIEKALSIGHSQGAWLISVISLAKSIFPVLAGILAARIGLTRSLKLSSLLILLGIIVPWLPAYGGWLAARFLFGIGGAMWVTLMGAVTMQVFTPKQRPFINSLNGIAVNTGVIIALWFTLPLASYLGWQAALSLYSIMSGFFALLLWFNGDLNSTNNSSLKKSAKYTDTLKLPVTWVISLAFTGPLALYLVFNTWLPIYYQEFLSIPKPQTMQWMSWMNLWGIPAALATGFFLQLLKKSRPFILAAAIILPVVSIMAVNSSDPSVLAVMLALTGVGLFLSVSPLITLLQNQPGMNPELIGLILGTMFSVTYILSAMAPGMVGYFYDQHINLKDLLSCCCFLGVTPLLAMLLSEKKI
jgi:CP family cyanate transporter-like MFS transporter